MNFFIVAFTYVAEMDYKFYLLPSFPSATWRLSKHKTIECLRNLQCTSFWIRCSWKDDGEHILTLVSTQRGRTNAIKDLKKYSMYVPHQRRKNFQIIKSLSSPRCGKKNYLKHLQKNGTVKGQQTAA